MLALKDRLAEVMTAMSWDRSDLVRVSKQSSSVVSQWLGHGSKEIRTIAKLEAVLAIERESGFSALWVAKGKGPKRAPVPINRLVAQEPPAAFYAPPVILEQLAALLATVPPAERSAVAANLHGLAMDGGASHWQTALTALLLKRAA
jgi:hypothetical protein